MPLLAPSQLPLQPCLQLLPLLPAPTPLGTALPPLPPACASPPPLLQRPRQQPAQPSAWQLLPSWRQWRQSSASSSAWLRWRARSRRCSWLQLPLLLSLRLPWSWLLCATLAGRQRQQQQRLPL